MKTFAIFAVLCVVAAAFPTRQLPSFNIELDIAVCMHHSHYLPLHYSCCHLIIAAALNFNFDINDLTALDKRTAGIDTNVNSTSSTAPSTIARTVASSQSGGGSFIQNATISGMGFTPVQVHLVTVGGPPPAHQLSLGAFSPAGLPGKGCSPFPSTTPDLSNTIVVLSAGDCSFAQKVQNARAHSAQYFLTDETAKNISSFEEIRAFLHEIIRFLKGIWKDAGFVDFFHII
jgi:hypothetical protein